MLLAMASLGLAGVAADSAADRPHSHIHAPAEIEEDHGPLRSEEHTSELQSLMRISYAVFCLKQKRNIELIKYKYLANILSINNSEISSSTSPKQHNSATT